MFIMLQVNDYRNGHATGFCESIAIEGDLITLHCGENTFQADATKKRFRLGRRWFAYQSYQVWVGNWCWDGVEVQPAIAVAILNWARTQKGWQVEVASMDLWEWWYHDHEPMTAERLLSLEVPHG